MADADDIAVADKDMRFAKRDALVDQLGRAGDDEERVAILLELRTLMGVRRVLDRERMQVELLLHAMEQIGIGPSKPIQTTWPSLRAQAPASSMGMSAMRTPCA